MSSEQNMRQPDMAVHPDYATLSAPGERIGLSNEWHARPNISLAAPLRCTHIIELHGKRTAEDTHGELGELCALYAQSPPAAGSRWSRNWTRLCIAWRSTMTRPPAMRTCEAAERRTQEIAQRVNRAANLLTTMVDMEQTRQSHGILESMVDRANTQLHLQQAVEGFSIFAISYYAVGMIKYVLEAAKGLGVSVDSAVVSGV